ncbi:MAG: D-tyrosyl-tRNA(Tyr) deacylase [candidate division WOR-3 bacterium]|nr:MAG: D-tyrosyl-tRNA(Tyr) deacylase [candidate division WOR-3 bacterium]
MKAVIQRVSRAHVQVGDKTVAHIGRGLLILIGIKKGDTEQHAQLIAKKCADLRIFEDENGKFNHSARDIGAEALVVSQFTLLGDTARGRRPSFTDAESPQRAERLYEYFGRTLSQLGVPTQHGVFGARMVVSLDNDGPVTILLEA